MVTGIGPHVQESLAVAQGIEVQLYLSVP